MHASRSFAVAGATGAALAVALGAFGAHALRDTLDAHTADLWRTATHYLGWHALALVVLGLGTRRSMAGTSDAEPLDRPGRIAGFSFLAGLPLFCGSLYALALGAPHGLGAVAPFGGGAFIAGWLALAVHAARRR